MDPAMVLGELSFMSVPIDTEGYLRRFVAQANEKTLKSIVCFATAISVMPKSGLRQKIRVAHGLNKGIWTTHTCFYEPAAPECGGYEEFEQAATCSLENGSVGFGMK